VERLSGKVAFITGGGTGIGRACALAFAAEGAKIALAGRRKEPLEAVTREIESSGGNAATSPIAKPWKLQSHVSRCTLVI